MALERVRLDDLTWEQMVLAIRRRIAAASGQEWTHHAPVDPGVTLLELYAWLLEQRVYWMDQVTPSFVRAALGLVGESPRRTQSATTVLKFDAGSFDVVKRGTRIHLVKQPGTVFSTAASLTRLPVERIGLEIGGKDLEPDLQYGRLIPLFPPNSTAGDIKITLWLKGAIPPHGSEPMALLFDLQTPSRISPQWSHGATRNVPVPAVVKFLYGKTAGKPPAPFEWVHDGTGGLRRSGIVRLRMPGDWQPEGGAVDGLVPYAIWMRVEQATFTSSPMLKRLIPNVTIARHRHRVVQRQFHVDWLPLPGNEIALAELKDLEPDKDQPALESAIALRLKERDEKWYRWGATPDLAFHGSGDRVFIVDRERGLLRFGDGLTGRLPVPFAPVKKDEQEEESNNLTGDPANVGPEADPNNVKVCFFAGGGSAGNLGSSLSWEGEEDPAVKATNVVSAEGGTEAESPAASSERAAAALRRVTRAVTADDYEEIAMTTPGIAIKRAHAAVGYHPEHPCTPLPGAVTVFVIPDAPRPTANGNDDDDDAILKSVFAPAPVPDPGALAAIRARMDEMRLVASEVFVLAPRYRPVVLKISVEGDPVDPAAVREKIKQRLADFLDPLVGGDRKRGWPFGEPLRPSVLLRESQRAIKRSAQAISVSIRLPDQTDEPPDCSDVKIGEHELVVLKEVNVQITRSAAAVSEQGGLR